MSIMSTFFEKLTWAFIFDWNFDVLLEYFIKNSSKILKVKNFMIF